MTAGFDPPTSDRDDRPDSRRRPPAPHPAGAPQAPIGGPAYAGGPSVGRAGVPAQPGAGPVYSAGPPAGTASAPAHPGGAPGYGAPTYPGDAPTSPGDAPTDPRGQGYSPTAGSGSPPGAGGSSGSSTAEVAKEQAGEVMGTAADAGRQVVQSTREQVGEVTAEAGRQARQLADQIRSEVTDQAATQQQRAAGGLRSLADELSGMADRSDQDGPATDLVRQAAHKMYGIAQWLQDREPGGVLDEVRAFARRRPGTYLAIAAGAGVLAGRLTRGLTASGDDSAMPPPSGRSTGSSYRVPGPPPNGRPAVEVRPAGTPSPAVPEPTAGPVDPESPTGAMPPVRPPLRGADPWGDLPR